MKIHISTSNAIESNNDLSGENHFLQLVLDGIEQCRNLEILYGDDTATRTLSVHVVRTTSANEISFEGVQVHNQAKAGEDGRWKTFRLDRVKSAQLTNCHFMPSTEFDPTDKRYTKGLIACVPVIAKAGIAENGNGFFPIRFGSSANTELHFY